MVQTAVQSILLGALPLGLTRVSFPDSDVWAEGSVAELIRRQMEPFPHQLQMYDEIMSANHPSLRFNSVHVEDLYRIIDPIA